VPQQLFFAPAAKKSWQKKMPAALKFIGGVFFK